MKFKFSLKSLQLFFVLYGSLVPGWSAGVTLVFCWYLGVFQGLPLFHHCSGVFRCAVPMVFRCSVFRRSGFIVCRLLLLIFHAEQFRNRLQLVHVIYSKIILLHGHFPLYTFIVWFDKNFFWKNASRLLRKGSPQTVVGRASIYSRAGLVKTGMNQTINWFQPKSKCWKNWSKLDYVSWITCNFHRPLSSVTNIDLFIEFSDCVLNLTHLLNFGKNPNSSPLRPLLY